MMRFEDLSNEQRAIVRRHYTFCMAEPTMDCRRLHSSVEEFWEEHKTEDFPDFLDGRYIDYNIHKALAMSDVRFLDGHFDDTKRVI